MPKKVQTFDEPIQGFQDAIARKKGQRIVLRASEIARVKPTRPRRTDLAKVQTPLPDSRR